MPDYKNGKIYKLWSPQSNEIYIGSTTQPLYRRLSAHKKNMDCASKILFEKYDDIRIELLEYFPCNNKEELNKKEGEYIRDNNCINRCIAGRTRKEWREYNKEHIKEYNQKKITCACGRTLTFHNKSRHERSQVHQDAIGGASVEDLTSATDCSSS